MPDDVTPVVETPQAGNVESVQTTAPVAATETAEELRARLADEQRQRSEANREAQALRKRLREFEAAADAAKVAQMSDAERQAARLVELEAQVASHAEERRQTAVRLEVARLGATLGVVDIEAAEKLLPPIKFDDEGKPENLATAMRDLVKARPWLLGGGATASNPTRSASDATEREQRAQDLIGGPRRSIWGANPTR